MARSRPPHVDDPLFFLDYDGTLAPIVDDPMAAHPHPEVPALVERLAERYPLWVITGRHLRDLDVLLDISVRAVGLHGTQRGEIGGEIEAFIPEDAAQAIDAWRRRVPNVEGLNVEDKGPTFALHYRTAPNEREALEAIEAWLANLPEMLEAVRGKKVVELRARGHNKGVAVRKIAEEHPERTPIYLGDDVTDEDAFRALGDEAITVKVGEGETVAAYHLPDIDEVVAYLRGYLDD